MITSLNFRFITKITVLVSAFGLNNVVLAQETTDGAIDNALQGTPLDGFMTSNGANSSPSLADDALLGNTQTDGYLSSDIIEAVEAARNAPQVSNFVGYERYNRTTSKSFLLPRMLNAEMTEYVIEGAMGPTAAGDVTQIEAARPVTEAALGQLTEQDEQLDAPEDTVNEVAEPEIVQERTTIVPQANYTTNIGSLGVTNIRSRSTISASVR